MSDYLVYSGYNRSVLELYSNEINVLDIGCATGELGFEIKKINPLAKVSGVDISEESLKYAANKLDRVSKIDLNNDKLCFSCEKFDLIILGDVLEHLINPKVLLFSCKEILAENGRIIISIPNIAHWSARLMLFKGHFEYTDNGLMDKTHLRFFTDTTARRMLKEVGLKVEKFHSVPDNLNVKNILLKLFLRFLRSQGKYRWTAYQLMYEVKC